MADEQRKEATPKEILKVVRKRADDGVSVYTNTAHIDVTYFDFKISFGQFVNYDAETETAAVSDSVVVWMSPEHAKALHVILGKNLEIFERDYGPIRKAPAPSSETAQHEE